MALGGDDLDLEYGTDLAKQSDSTLDDLDFGKLVTSGRDDESPQLDAFWAEKIAGDKNQPYDALRDFELSGSRPTSGSYILTLKSHDLAHAAAMIVALLPPGESVGGGPRLTFQLMPTLVRLQALFFEGFLELEVLPVVPIPDIDPEAPVLFDLDFDDVRRTARALEGDVQIEVDLAGKRVHFRSVTFERPIRMRDEGVGFKLTGAKIGVLDAGTLRSMNAHALASAARFVAPAVDQDTDAKAWQSTTFRDGALVGGRPGWHVTAAHPTLQAIDFNLPNRVLASLGRLDKLFREVDLVETPLYAIFRSCGFAFGLRKTSTPAPRFPFPGPETLKAELIVFRATFQRGLEVLSASLEGDDRIVRLRLSARKRGHRLAMETVDHDAQHAAYALDDLRYSGAAPTMFCVRVDPLRTAVAAFETTNFRLGQHLSKKQQFLKVDYKDEDSEVHVRVIIKSARTSDALMSRSIRPQVGLTKALSA